MTAGVAPDEFKPNQNEGMYKMFVSMTVFMSCVFAWITMNGCGLDTRGTMIMTFVISSFMIFLIVTVWFDGVYVYDKTGSDLVYRVNGIPGLTKDRKHYLTGEDAISKCMGVAGKTFSEFTKEEAFSDTERNIIHLFLSSLLGLISAGILHLIKV